MKSQESNVEVTVSLNERAGSVKNVTAVAS